MLHNYSVVTNTDDHSTRLRSKDSFMTVCKDVMESRASWCDVLNKTQRNGKKKADHCYVDSEEEVTPVVRQAVPKSRLGAFRARVDGNSFQCDQCNFCSRSLIVLTEHKKLLHRTSGPPPVRFECQECHATFTRHDRLLCHLQKHTGDGTTFDCYLCPGTFASEQNLVRHVKTTHGSVESFSCYYCKSTFSRKDNLLVHIRRHLSDASTC